MYTVVRKRCLPSPLDTITENLSLSKKQKIESEPLVSFSSLHDGVAAEATSVFNIDFSLGELTPELSSSKSGHEGNGQVSGSIFLDMGVKAVPCTETSEVSSDEDNAEAKAQSGSAPFSPHSDEAPPFVEGSLPAQKKADTISNRKNDNGLSQKRQADRAARNRESSRRTREKAKIKFKALESDNITLRDMVRSMTVQNEHLLAQLNRAHVMQQSCPMCKYNDAMDQQPLCAFPPSPR